MALTMTKEEREAFLADIHVAVISVAEDGHGPLVVPIYSVTITGHGLQIGSTLSWHAHTYFLGQPSGAAVVDADPFHLHAFTGDCLGDHITVEAVGHEQTSTHVFEVTGHYSGPTCDFPSFSVSTNTKKAGKSGIRRPCTSTRRNRRGAVTTGQLLRRITAARLRGEMR